MYTESEAKEKAQTSKAIVDFMDVYCGGSALDFNQFWVYDSKKDQKLFPGKKGGYELWQMASS